MAGRDRNPCEPLRRRSLSLLAVAAAEAPWVAPLVAVVVLPYATPGDPLAAVAGLAEWLVSLFVGYLVSEFVFPDLRE